MITSIFRPITEPVSHVGELVADYTDDIVELVQETADRATQFGRDAAAFLPGGEEYQTWMGFAARAAITPLLLPTPMGALAFGQLVLATAYVSSMTYDFVQEAETIEAFFEGVKQRHEDAGTWPW